MLGEHCGEGQSGRDRDRILADDRPVAAWGHAVSFEGAVRQSSDAYRPEQCLNRVRFRSLLALSYVGSNFWRGACHDCCRRGDR